jgi:alpha-L-rhamnosidase
MKIDLQRRRVLRLMHDGAKGAIAWHALGGATGLTAIPATVECQASASGARARPAGLLVNLLPGGLGVSPESLRFSWVVPAVSEAARQSAYRLQIATTADKLCREADLIWDSGRVASNDSTAVPAMGDLAGHPLARDSIYYWRVRVWDQDGRASEWSEPQRLITEAAATWVGVPIWIPPRVEQGIEPDDHWLLARTEFDVSREIEAAWIRATAESPEQARQYVFRLFVNGEFVGVGPVRSWDPAREARYNTMDVSALLKKGRNAVAALCYSTEGHAFLADIVLVFKDGGRQIVGTGDRWRVRSGKRWRPPSGYTGGGFYEAPQEFIDAREEPMGWTRPEFVATGWVAPAQRPALPPLRPAATENLALHIVQPAKVQKLGSGHWLLDMGRELVGGLSIDVEGRSGQTIEIRLGEEKSQDGGARFELRARQVYREIWTLREGPQHIEHWGYRAFRWVELLAEPGVNLTDAVTALVLRLPWSDGDAAFRSSNADLDRVWEMCRYSIAALRFDIYQDTPTREREPYEGDALINQLSEYSVQRSYALSRYSTSYLIRRPTWPCEYRMQTPIMAWRDYMMTGDPSQLEADYSLMVERQLIGSLNRHGWVEKIAGHSSEANADLVDWPVANRDGYVFTSVNTVINSWQFAALDALSRIAGVLGRKDDQKRFAQLAKRLRAALNTAFLTSDGVYTDGLDTDHRTQHATAIALALGVIPPDREAAAARRLARQGMRMSVYGAQFLLDALYRGREAKAALRLMTSRETFSWLHMIDDLNATIAMEAWDPSIKPNTTFSHAWGTAPANVVQRHIVGFEVIEPGAAHVRIAPQPGDLEWFEAKVPTIRGAVSVSYCRAGPTVLEVTLPANVRGSIELAYDALAGHDPRTLEAVGAGYRPTIRHVGDRLVVERVESGRLRLESHSLGANIPSRRSGRFGSRSRCG